MAVANQESGLSTEASATWCVDVVIPADGGWVAAGWAVGARGKAQELGFRINRKRVPTPELHPRSDIPVLFPDRPGSDRAGFFLPLPTQKVVNATARRPLHLSLSVAGVVQPRLDYFYPGEHGPVPPPENRRRVHGGDLLSSYLLEGFSAFTKIERSLVQVAGRSYRSFGSIVDWGVGCGRFSRYFEPDRSSGRRSIVGIDIDEANISWCQENLPWMRAVHVDSLPPTPLREASADLVIGVSVFTHLRESDMTLWLEELRRITRPGALLAVTTHGPTTAARSGLSGQTRAILDEQGYLDLGQNPDIDGAVHDDPGYYRNVFHTEQYLRSIWSRHFEVLAIVEGLIGNHQDLVILRHPG